MFDRSRVRLTLGYVGILAFILLLFGAVVVIFFRYTVANLQDRQILAEAESREGIVSGGGNVYAGGSDEFGWSVVGPDGRPLGQTSTSSDFGLPPTLPGGPPEKGHCAVPSRGRTPKCGWSAYPWRGPERWSPSFRWPSRGRLSTKR